MIRFLHGDAEVSLEDWRADATILDYLRDDPARRGTKEGCASGDCGACTVAVASSSEEGLSYAPVNACIATLGSLHGRQLISVEDLAEGGTPHPVQSALIDCHGSQCGFCTPGFVMSLFVFFHSERGPDRESIVEALGGNLCRCTGYRPIIDAAIQALEGSREDAFSQREAATLDRLRALAETATELTALTQDETRYFRPESREALTTLLDAHEELRIIAGGTDLMLEQTQGLQPLPMLVDLTGVHDLHENETDNSAIHIGAAVSHHEARTTILGDYPELGELIERFGSLQIRSQGTVVGNIANASPIGDWPPVLIALEAELLLESSQGERRMPVDDFFLAYRQTALRSGEYLRRVSVPRRGPQLFLRAYKISKRFEDDISSVCGVFALKLDGERISSARVAFGGMAAVPARARHCEAALLNLDLRQDSLADVASALRQDFAPITDARASATYRSLVAERLLDRLQAEYSGENARVHAHVVSGSGG
ncbi:MAG: xanthine dehydrogenase small subunit [Pseudomonadota bacterium]